MKKRVLFIDRDGTLIYEPPDTFQVDSLEKLEFKPKVFRNMFFMRNRLDYELAMITNQDGLGTDDYPREIFDSVQDKLITAFDNEGVWFEDIFIDPSKDEDNSPNRKPGTGMLKGYFHEDYDLENSFVIGDRITDVELAKNLGAKCILLTGEDMSEALKSQGLENQCALITNDWDEIYGFLSQYSRIVEVSRNTKETQIVCQINLDGKGNADIDTGIGFFDHMLEQIAKHAKTDLWLKAKGDTHVDEHHTIEDAAMVLGEAFNKAMGDKRGINRYGFVLPMDDALSLVAIDMGGRSYLVWNVDFKREKIGEMPTEMFKHFFKSFSDASKCNLYIESKGENEHHKIESIFKAFARALRNAINRDAFNYELPSTKGVI